MVLPLFFGSTMGWVVIGAAMLLLWLATYYLIGKPLSDMVRGVPVVGRDLANAILTGMTAVRDWALDWAATGLNGIVELASVPVRAVFSFVEAVAGAIDAVVATAERLARAVDGAIGTLARRIDNALNFARDVAQTAGQALVQAGKTWDRLVELIRVGVPAAIAVAVDAVIDLCRAMVNTEVIARRRAIDDVRIDYGRAIDGEAGHRVKGDARTAAAAAAAAAALGIKLGQAEQGARTYTDSKVRGVDQQLTQLRDVSLPAALASALAATAAVATSLAQVRTQCIDPMCSTWGRQAGLIQALMTGVEVALVMSLVASAVRDPEGSAQVMGGVARSAHDMGASLMAPFIGRAA